jgi:hypothetical protein
MEDYRVAKREPNYRPPKTHSGGRESKNVVAFIQESVPL